MSIATATAHPNIAFIKYWGNLDNDLRLPANPSISMCLDGLVTETTVRWDDAASSDELTLNGESASQQAIDRVSKHLDQLRERLKISAKAVVTSTNNFPMGAGIASSASAFAALTVAAVAAAGVKLDERELTTLARLGSGSASRSVPSGFVEWHMGMHHAESYAESVAPADHWGLVDVIAVVSADHKAVISSKGHMTAATSDLQTARVAGASERLINAKEAIIGRDFDAFAEVVEHDSNLMHAVMMTSRPPLFYWQPTSLTIMEAVRSWRRNGLRVCYTLDAGPNVHCICIAEDADAVASRLSAIGGIQQVLKARAGGGALITHQA